MSVFTLKMRHASSPPERARPSLYLAVMVAATFCLSACKPAASRSTVVESKPIDATPAPAEDTPAKFVGIAQARIEKGYAVVSFENGRKGMFPFSGLKDTEREWLTGFAAEHPLAHGKSTVTVSRAEATKTIVRHSQEGTSEVLQLRPPAILRDQIGSTCALYANVHYLDIAGYPLDNATIYKVIDKSPVDDPWKDPLYRVRMDRLFTEMVPAPILHYPRNVEHPFEWAREQLRLGRPILALLPEDIWQALPAQFLATHPWDGAKVGHAVVINGFVLDSADPKKNTFHIINSWRDLAEFDIPADVAAKNVVVIEQSISPKGEIQAAAEQLVVTKVTQLNAVGKQFLFAVETNLGARKVVAANEEAARRLMDDENHPAQRPAPVEMPSEADRQGVLLNGAYDEIGRTIPHDVQDGMFADIVAQITHQPKNGPVPHVDAILKQKSGSLYFVRVGPDLVLKIAAESATEAMEIARSKTR